jgi:hypothetical protein
MRGAVLLILARRRLLEAEKNGEDRNFLAASQQAYSAMQLLTDFIKVCGEDQVALNSIEAAQNAHRNFNGTHDAG